MKIQDYFANKHINKHLRRELAEICGVRTPTVTRWITGGIKRPEPHHVTRIAMHFGDDPAGLLSDLGYHLEAEEYRLKSPNLMLAESHDIAYTESKSVPIVGRVEAGIVKYFYNWDGADFPPGTADNYVEMPTASIRQGAYALTIEDDSMEPTIRKNSQIIINPQTLFVPGRIYIVLATQGRKWLKRVTVQDGIYCLSSDNPQYSPIHLKAEEVIRLHLVDWIRAH